MKQKSFKNTSGITLIALVVTIVVLLILAGISINMVLGDNGLITKAKDAKDATRYASIKDEYDMYKYGKAISSLTGTSSTEAFADFLDKLEGQGSISSDERTQIEEEGKLTISEKYEIIFNESKTLVQAFIDGDIKVGDYLNYSDYVNATNSYTSVTDENGWADQTYSVDTEAQWRVLGNTYTYTASDYTPESYINGKSNATAGDTVDITAYVYSCGALTIDSTIQEMLFAGTTADDNYAKSYFLASPGVCYFSSFAGFGPGCAADGTVCSGGGLFASYGGWGAIGYAVRPVVCLNSDVTVDDLQVIDGEVETWTTTGAVKASGDYTNGEAGNHDNIGVEEDM